MPISRREFVKLGAHAAFGGLLVYTLRGVVLPQSAPRAADAEGNSAYDQYRPEDHDWAFVIDTMKCIGCGRCARACKQENNVPWEPQCNRTWVERYSFAGDGEVHVDSPEGGINGFADEPLPEAIRDKEITKSFFVPKLCNQCDNSPCVQVCPVAATYKTADGIVLINRDKCIGCRYCIQACPYGMRYLLPDERVADKCTWCYHRITRGRLPACVEACPVGARKFGDLRDPESTVSKILAERNTSVLKPEMGTNPRTRYLDLDGEVV